MNGASVGTHDLAEPYLLGWLASVGLDVEYVRGEGNTLYYRDSEGREIPVVDYAGGYGSLMLGHNHPEINAYAKSLLDGGIPVHAQFSRHPYANDVAQALNAILRRELGDDAEEYSAIFANTGAEAVEAAVKHAELDRRMRMDAAYATASAQVAAAQAAGAGVGAAVVEALGLPAGAGIEVVADEITRRNDAVRQRTPLFLSLEGGFHGKLVGSVQLTHNEGYRAPFAALAAQARFVPRDRPEVLKEVVEAERAELLGLAVEDGTAVLVRHAAPVFCAFVLEPIQGEGGIRVLGREFAEEIQRVCAAVDCPVIVDEVQSGMGRSGSFFASSRVGLRGDYYALAKSLGGGIAKASVMLVRRSRYRPEFELVHSSTFAKDAFSCHIALKVLELMEADGGRVYRLAAERGQALKDVFEALRKDFPDVVEDVRGEGLMLGLEFRDQTQAASQALRENAGTFGYLVAGYLLREHRLRTFPTASAVHTLRFEPSVHLTDEEIAQLEAGLRDVCAILRAQDGERLLLPAPPA
ncbi:aminotransferase class III-fold pyridoxal phosphate-dependent enzyme [Streptomyces sp. NPDC049555]|uniref:aspartate aminotransferase family protein n=1 Tax=Streptomyces sp. NPDC049555 TaxID=3154930 RepID=UPI00343EDBF5